MSAPASSAASRGAASLGSPMGVAASTSTPSDMPAVSHAIRAAPVMPGLVASSVNLTFDAGKGDTHVTVTLARDTDDGTAGDPLTERRGVLRRRLLGAPRTAEAKLWAFLGPAIVTVFGGIIRFWNLGRPHQLVFDETYYVKEGWSMFLYGYERKQDKSTLITNNPDG